MTDEGTHYHGDGCDPPHLEYELVMPFVTVKSVGGPHDDDSYAAGWAMGVLDQMFTMFDDDPMLSRMHIFRQVVHMDNVAQADLLAMQHGYAMTVEDEDADDEWRSVRFAKVGYPPVTTDD